MTAQEVIKSFMNQLANHGYANSDSVGAYMLDSAVRASSRYSSIQEVIDAMKADQTAAEMEAVEEVLGSDYAGKTIAEVESTILSADAKDYDTDNQSNAYYNETNDERSTVKNFINERKAYIFLEKYCGIILNKKFFFNSSGEAKNWSTTVVNEDTGAITGSDAGGSETKTASSIVPEIFINTYTASTATAQNIITNNRDWVVQATDVNDTITSNGADSINTCAGDDSIIANADGATVTSGDGADFITISKDVTDITLADLNEYDTLTISGTFDVGSAQIEDNLLVVTDKTGSRKIRLGDFDTAKNAKVNSTTISEWLTNAGVDINNLTSTKYSDGKVSSNVANNSTDSAAVTVDLNDVDTSAAGNVSINGAVVGSLSSTFPNASTFTRNGLTIHLLGVSSTGGTGSIVEKTLDELTDDQRTIVAGLFKWWLGSCLTLSEESYGLSFKSSTAAVRDMGLFFHSSSSNNTLAAAPYWPRSADGSITQMMLNINTSYFSGISSDNLDGTSSATTNYLDRTLAHELTHSNMETNINYFVKLPQFIVEGSAELVHGIDDERGNRIFSIAANSSTLDTVLDLTNTGTGNANFYAGGYMFLRYFAKQAAEQTLPAFGEITATVNLSRNGIYYISGNSTVETASTAAQDITLGTISNGVYTIENTGVHQVITNTRNFKISGLTVNDTLIGSDAADIVETAEGSYITSGKGADSIQINGQFATIDAGTGNDAVIAQDGGHHLVNLGDGNDFIKFNQSATYNNTVSSGAGNDSISISGSAYNSSILTGAGNDSIYFIGQYNTINAGTGDDYIYANATNSVFEYAAGDGADLIEGFDSTSTLIIGEGSGTYSTANENSNVIVTVGDENITLASAANLSSVNIKGKKIITLTEDADAYENTSGNVTILALGGDDSIRNSGSNVLIDLGTGDDSIFISDSVTSFNVANFGAGDVIQFDSTIDNLETISGGIVAGNVTIGGLSNLSATTKNWSLNKKVATHSTKISEGAILSSDNKTITYTAASVETVTVSGVAATGGLSIDLDNKIVTVDETSLDTLNVTISDGYNLSLASDVAQSSASAAAWSLDDKTAIYSTSATTAGYTLEDNQIIYTAATGGESLVTVSGVTSEEGLAIDTDKKIVTVDELSLDTLNVTISDGYDLSLASSVVQSSVTAAAWSLNNTKAIYSVAGITEGYSLEDNQIIYTAASGGTALVTVGGVTSEGGLAIDTNNKIVTVGESSLDTLTVTISSGYDLSLASGVVKSSVIAAAWSLDDMTAIYSASGLTAGYSLEDNQITYSELISGAELVTVGGVTSKSGLAIDTDKKIVTVGESSLDTLTVTISSGYDLSLASDVVKPSVIAAAWSFDDTTAIYSASATTEGYSLKDNQITYSESISGAELVTVGGVTSKSGLAIDTDKKIVTVGESSLDTLTVTISSGYDLSLASDVVKPSVIAAAWSLDDTTAIYSASATTEGYSLEDNQIEYATATGGESLVTVRGVTSTDGLAINTNNKIVTVGESSLDTLTVTISDDYTLALASGVVQSSIISDIWHLNGTTATYSISGMTEGYALKRNQIVYNTASDGEILIEMSGIATAPTVKGDTVKLTNKNFSGNVSVVSGGDYAFELKNRNYAGKSFSGSADADYIINNGSNVTIAGGSGNDTLRGGYSYDFLDGGSDNDILIGGNGKDTFAHSGGNDTISNYNARDKISLATAYEDFTVDGSDVIFNFDSDSLTIKDGVNKRINFLSGKKTTTNYYTADGIFDKNRQSATLSASAQNFTASSRLATIDGSATNSISIVGNSKRNIIRTGVGGSTLAGGRGNDTLYGGDGSDIFIYNKGDGNDIIENFGASDKISLGTGATIKSSKIKNGDTVIKTRGGSLTIKDTSEFVFIEDGVEKIFSGGNVSDTSGTSVTLSSRYNDTFELGDYKNADASLAKKSVTLAGGDQDNYLIGGKGKDCLVGGAGNDTLWGGKKNDSLYGGDGDDNFIFSAGDGNDTIFDYASGELLTILNKNGSSGSFKNATYKDNTLTLSIQGGGKVIFSGVDTSTAFNINSENYHISDKTLVK